MGWRVPLKQARQPVTHSRDSTGRSNTSLQVAGLADDGAQ